MQLGDRHGLGHFHETGAARFALGFGQHARDIVGGGAFDRTVGKAAGTIDFGLADEVEQVLELLLRLAREAGDKGAADHEFGADLAPTRDPLQVLLAAGRPLHALEHVGVAVLQRHVEVRQHQAARHQRNDFVDARIGVYVVQAHPGAIRLGNFAQRAHEFEHAGLDRLAIPEAGAVLHVDAVGRGVLADHQQFLHAALEQGLGFAEHIAHRTRDQVAAHRGNDAKGATVIAAFADLQVGVVPRRQLEARHAKGVRHEVDERIVRLRQVGVHGIHHLLRGMRASDGQHAGVHLAHEVAALVAGLGAQAAGDDHTAILGERFADGVQAFLHGIVDEAAGVDDHEVGALEGLGGLIALGTQLGQDQFGIGQCLGTTKADEADLGGGRRDGTFRGGNFAHRPLLSQLSVTAGHSSGSHPIRAGRRAALRGA
ncbi:hypothetical protein FQZ97_595320 [compost metagenome]